MAFSRDLELESSSPPLLFPVRRREPELVAPAKPTPHESKTLSEIDSQAGLRTQIPIIQFYRNDPSMEGKDPVQVIRTALAETLVFYYPFAGRLRDAPDGKLLVDCNEEGVMFIEADADVTLDQFGAALKPPFPRFEELLYQPPGSEGITDTPIFLIQVTRLKCGGFIFALRFNHAMTDGVGLIHFTLTMAGIACGATKEPPFQPVWARELLCARDPPRVTFNHREYEQLTDSSNDAVPTDFEQRSFFFGPAETASIRALLPDDLYQHATTFEVLTSYVWRCRTKALNTDPTEDVRMMCIVDARGKFNPPFPAGFYGSCFAFPAAVTTAGELSSKPLEYAVRLIQKASGEVSEEYIHSVADLMASEGRPLFTVVRSCLVLDTTQAGFRNLDFGWGKALYGGMAVAGAGAFPAVNFHVPSQNAKGEEGILVLVSLPGQAMKAFARELDEHINMLESNKAS